MILSVRCYSCGKVIGGMWQRYQNKLKNNITPEKALDELGLVRYCCRTMLLSHVELIDELLDFKESLPPKPVTNTENMDIAKTS
jgi:DNA-directed RNA polymerase subunit N (RpoN/RPB10)